MTDLVLFGMQGSGKGTQSQIIAEQLGYKIFETGGQLRRLAAEDSELGRKVKKIIEAGHLVPDEVVMEIIEDFLGGVDASTRVIFDGIPRSESQRQLFEREMEKASRYPTALYIRLSESDALARLLGRKTCAGCGKIFGAKDDVADRADCPVCGGELKVRADDTEDAIRTRLNVYAEQTLPVVEKYRQEGRLIEVDGGQPVEEVTQKILAELEEN